MPKLTEHELAVIRKARREPRDNLTVLVRYGSKDLEACLSLVEKDIMREVMFFGDPSKQYRLFKLKELSKEALDWILEEEC